VPGFWHGYRRRAPSATDCTRIHPPQHPRGDRAAWHYRVATNAGRPRVSLPDQARGGPRWPGLWIVGLLADAVSRPARACDADAAGRSLLDAGLSSMPAFCYPDVWIYRSLAMVSGRLRRGAAPVAERGIP
jgi:hypothetical protein